MILLKLTIHSAGDGKCCLSGKECDGVTVTFEDGTVTEQHLSWKSLRQLIAMKVGTKTHARSIPSAAPVATPALTDAK